ncbi:MAG: hypothetical protein ABFS09_11235, partial [Thermodesulfobacteriota bacterium]
MNVSLTPEMDKWISGKVKSGQYKSSSEVVREVIFPQYGGHGVKPLFAFSTIPFRKMKVIGSRL